MGERTEISWADATFNPWRGCMKVSPACANCYADTMSKRNPRTLGIWGPNGTRVRASAEMWGKPLKWNDKAQTAGERRRVFCASLADVFEDWDGPILNAHGDTLMICPNGHVDGSVWDVAPRSIECSNECGADMRPMTMDDVRRDLFKLIDATPHLDWLILTKRPENIRRMWLAPRGETGDRDWERWQHPLMYRDNCWLGVSVENQEYAYKRIPEVLTCRDMAPVLFLSCEPLLGPVYLDVALSTGDDFVDKHFGWLDQIDLVIAGGESGPNSRPSHPDWFCGLRDQCVEASVPFHFKQWGEWADAHTCKGGDWPFYAFDDGQPMARVGKKNAGRLLDGRTWDELPASQEAVR